MLSGRYYVRDKESVAWEANQRPTASLLVIGGASIQNQVGVTGKSLFYPLPLPSQPTPAGCGQVDPQAQLPELAKWCLWPAGGSWPATWQCFSDFGRAGK